MKAMTGDEIRQAYLDFFADKEHLILPSAPLVPQDDPSLLWINAGMAPFKPFFDGRKEPPRKRIVTSQKCIRTNDIENVGNTARHQTFFEMLGNFSFGDYFKEEAIAWAWEFVTEVLNLEKERLWITIYKDDDEAFEIWHKNIGLEKERIVRMGKKDNFWQIGTGPCGPCSEIHYDRGEEYGTGPEDVIGGKGDRFLEIWNLVFTQFDYTEDGEYLPLPNKNIDTGMGLERVASILQGVDSNFETDLLKSIIEFVEQDSGIEYGQDSEKRTAYRVIADHIRGITMAIYDGVLPSNEGRGYVIRRLLRRAVRYGGKLGYEEPFLYRFVPVVNEVMSGGYPELKDKEEHIKNVVSSEEERFYKTLDQGLSILNEMMNNLKEKGKDKLTGEQAFKLYDTYGFPLDLTRDVLAENGFKVDGDGFSREMEKQRERARNAREDIGFGSREVEKVFSSIRDEIEACEFIGYSKLTAETRIEAIIKDGKEVDSLNSGEEGEVILSMTPFYAESGGQIGDKGEIKGDNLSGKVNDVLKKAELIVHYVEITAGKLNKGQNVSVRVFSDIRKDTARNHSSTHLLHQALREVLGEHVNQSGSLVAPERLRFDFSHFSAVTEEELDRIEKRVNEIILDNFPVETFETTLAEAKEMGAAALFTEKYGENVRVVKMGDYSTELCGGTHVNYTGDIGLLKILSESGIAAGTRRIEALTGKWALDYVKEEEKTLKRASQRLSTTPEKLPERIELLLEKQNKLEREISALTDRLASSKSTDLLEQFEDVNGISLLAAEVEGIDNEGLRNLTDEIRDKIESGIIVLASRLEDKVIFVASVSEDLIKEGYHAGKLIGKVAKITGGGGGGRPDLAQAGGTRTDKIKEALAEVKNLI